MNSTDHKTLTVNLGARSYDIIIGETLLENLASHLAPFTTKARLHIVTDVNVHHHHGHHLDNLPKHSLTVLPDGEAQKSFSGLQTVLDDAFANNLSRGDIFVAFGGGVIGDLTGFAASTYKRGCRFIQIPTTLLAQVDSSVGGKTGINVAQGKNLVGAFHQPALVLSDTATLKTLPERQIKAGYAEVLKYGLLGDAEFFNWLDDHYADVLSLEAGAIAYAIHTSCETKARIVAEDELEHGTRALLNLGHTFGHALEAEAGYQGDLLHGEAVSIGMEMAFEFSTQLGLCDSGDRAKVSEHLAKTQMPQIGDATHLLEPDVLLNHMNQDKKNESGNLTLILARAIGKAFVEKDADKAAVLNYFKTLKKGLAEPMSAANI